MPFLGQLLWLGLGVVEFVSENFSLVPKGGQERLELFSQKFPVVLSSKNQGLCLCSWADFVVCFGCRKAELGSEITKIWPRENERLFSLKFLVVLSSKNQSSLSEGFVAWFGCRMAEFGSESYKNLVRRD